MKPAKYATAVTELLLIFPAVLFMVSLFVRNLQPQQYEPAHSAQQIVMWYVARTRLGLWVFLIALPLIVFISGCGMLLRRWSRDKELRDASRQMLTTIRTHLATLLIAGASLAAGGILGIVALHVLTD